MLRSGDFVPLRWQLQLARTLLSGETSINGSVDDTVGRFDLWGVRRERTAAASEEREKGGEGGLVAICGYSELESKGCRECL